MLKLSLKVVMLLPMCGKTDHLFFVPKQLLIRFYSEAMQKTITLYFFNTILFLSLINIAFPQGFLKTDGKKIVNAKGENVLLRGMGLGGWMVQEGYMLRIYNEGQQHRIKKRLEDLTSVQQTKEFYDTWLVNNTRKIDIDSMKSWGFNSVRLPMHYNLYTLPTEKEKE